MKNTLSKLNHQPRQISPIDQVIQGIDQAIQTIFGTPVGTGRPDPAIAAKPRSHEDTGISTQSSTAETSPHDDVNVSDKDKTSSNTKLSEQERRQSAALMRINHCGEVCAQALYQGQALTASSVKVRQSMQQASDEENDHLLWCKNRLDELDSHTSFLNPAWYANSFAIGAIAGMVGDKWSLGFVAETERQVVKHLDKHLHQISTNDYKTHAVLTQMKTDEAKHATNAVNNGAAELPDPIKKIMQLSSKIMTKTTYWV
ncbi:2-polyprenyl-3-methyl-6-methoxy-1,4-benzoquinol hydroxylase, coq7 type [hydrothermal vent metagenome]|uniref:2-polyprenyl-3-methyl-6-methoxy-1,4-benzoquinol hydroxylase, coq7 type n=1 Tax=hydrothermal vent metagenome TaxID=652676 RepID=A0A3B0Y311_9ZZZZ